jgi:hypothetical protein
MNYPDTAPTIRLAFSDGFKFHGPDTTLTVTATVNLSVPTVKHLGDGAELADGQVLTGPLNDFRVPNPQAIGWSTPAGSRVQGWSYDLAITVTAPDAPDALWVATIRPANGVETITPGMGTITGGTATGSVTVTETAPGVYTIGA